MANLEGMKPKYIGLLKLEDAGKYLSDEQRRALIDIEITVDRGRLRDGKPLFGEHEFIVVNTDEPYAEEVIEILKRHGHWG